MATTEQIMRLPPSKFKDLLVGRERELAKITGGRGISSGDLKRIAAEKEAAARSNAIELQRQKDAQAKVDAIQKQRRATEKKAAELVAIRQKVTRFKKLSSTEKRQFAKEQTLLTKASEFQELRASGRTITPKAQKIIKEAQEVRERIAQQQAPRIQKQQVRVEKEKKFLEKVEFRLQEGVPVSKFLLETQEKIGEKILETRFGKTKVGAFLFPSVKVGKGGAERFVSETGKFGLFAPGFQTTAQIAKAIQPTEVIFAGAKQVTKKGLTITDIGFATKETRGIARGVTKQIGVTPLGEAKSISIITGGEIGRAIRFPTGEIITKVRKPFFSISRAISKKEVLPLRVGKESFVKIGEEEISNILLKTKLPIREKFFVGAELPTTRQFIVGKVIKGKQRELFGTIAKTTEFDKKLISAALTQPAKSRDIISKGVVIGFPKETVKFISKDGVGQISKGVSAQALETTKAGISAALTKPVKAPVPKLSTVTGATIREVIVTPKADVQQVKADIILQKAQPIQIQTQGLVLGQRIKTDTEQLQKIQTQQKIKTAVDVATIQKIKIDQPIKSLARIDLLVPIKQRQIQRAASSLAPLVPIIPTETSISRVPFLVSPSRQIGLPATFGVQVRRKGKFKTIGAGLTLGKAISVGQERVGTTLAATFRLIPQIKGRVDTGIRVPKGFKQKPGLTFIETPSLRLSTGKEVREIQTARINL